MDSIIESYKQSVNELRGEEKLIKAKSLIGGAIQLIGKASKNVDDKNTVNMLRDATNKLSDAKKYI